MNCSRILATGASSWAICRIQWMLKTPGCITISSNVLAGGFTVGEILLRDSTRHTVRLCMYFKGDAFAGQLRYRNREDLYKGGSSNSYHQVDYLVKGTWYE